ncbi:MAG: hypothetical protein QW331_04845 [Candidatus Woesearchaeota archaeon]
MIRPIFISEGLRMFRRRHFSLQKRFQGNANQICSRIVNSCWNGRYFQTSLGHFCEFYTRDFGWCTESLLKLDYKEKVRKSLEYALEKFKDNKGVTVAISPTGVCFDFPYYAPDSIAYLLQSLRLLNDKKLINKYRSFLEKEIQRFETIALDKKTGLIRADRYFSSMKDYAQRKSSCYDNCMLAVVTREAKKLKIKNNLEGFSAYKKRIKNKFWNGGYFFDDLNEEKCVSGDANVIPFYMEVFDETKMVKSAVKSLQHEKLDRPFPLKYLTHVPSHKMLSIEIFAGDYERDTIWMHLGLMYLKILKKIDEKQFLFHKDQYRRLIEKHHNFLEVFDKNGKPFSTPFYYTDEGMLWAANYLTL